MLRNAFTFKRLFSFSGRATRREYFLIFGAMCVAWFVLFGLEGALFGPPGSEVATPREPSAVFVLIYVVAGIASLVILLAALVRRVHDHDKSGVIILLNMIPMIGWIIWLILTLTPGNAYENSYGPDPREPIPQDQGELETIFS